MRSAAHITRLDPGAVAAIRRASSRENAVLVIVAFVVSDERTSQQIGPRRVQFQFAEEEEINIIIIIIIMWRLRGALLLLAATAATLSDTTSGQSVGE